MSRFKERIKGIISFIIMLCLVCTNIMFDYEKCYSQSMTSNFTRCTLTGDPGNDIATVAEAQAGKTQAQLGYTEAWCADFVSDCAKIAGLSYAVPEHANVYGLYNNIINAGGSVVSNPQRGDIVFYRCTACNGWMHVAIMQDSVHSVHGNYWNPTSKVFKDITYYEDENGHSTNNSLFCTYVRPKYNNPDPVILPDPEFYPVKNGTYCIRNAGQGYQMNVYAGTDADGTKVVGWCWDGSTEQKFRVYHENNGAYWIYAMCSSGGNGRVLDINVGSDNTLGTGDFLDIWSRGNYNDCQLFNIIPVDNGLYVFELTSMDNKVLTLASESNNAAITLQPYTGSERQKWYFCDASKADPVIVDVDARDKTAPVIKDVSISNVSSKGYTVSCTVTDNVAVDRVQFPTWTDKNGQDDMFANWNTNSKASGTISGNTVTYRVNVSEHNNETGSYTTHIYAFDKAGNQTSTGKIVVVPNGLVPVNVGTYNGHIYAYFSDCMTWHTARENCEKMGGHLATITSQEENDFVKNLTNGNYAFIGCTDEAKEGTWTWLTGESFSYSNWASGEPNNTNSLEHFGEIKKDGKWNDHVNQYDDNRGFVLEIDSELSSANEVSANGYLYRAYDVSMPWEVAKVYCEKYGGSLAVPTSETQNTIIKNLIADTQKSYYFLGVTDKAKEGTWVDVNGKAISYNNWGSGEPNGDINENYVVTGRNAKWNDTRSYDDFKGFIYQKEIVVTGIALNKNSLTLTEGGSESLTATISPSNALNQSVTWSSSNTSVATVDSTGKITAVKAGTATITATSNNGKTASCTVTVKAKTVDVTGITLNKTSLTLTEENTETLTATIAPSNATNKTVTWSSNNTSVATVDSTGKVTAVKAGTATITATSNNGKTASCAVTVKAKTVDVTGITLNKTRLTLMEGESETLQATIVPSNATDKTVTWTISNSKIATVDSTGKVTALKAGSATITATTTNGKTVSCILAVLGHNPRGNFDAVEVGTGYINVRGWAFDADSLESSVKINVYVDETYVAQLTANKTRTDVNNTFSGIVGDKHGFEGKVYLNKDISGSKVVKAVAINIGTGSDVVLGEKTVEIINDTTLPVITDVKVTDLSSTGYTLTCTVTDDVKIDTVRFPTWTELNGQDDIFANWNTNSNVVGTIDGDTVTYRVNTSDHNNENGKYITDIYAYDKAGNRNMYRKTVNVPELVIDVTGITLNKKSLTLTEENTETLTATIAPSNATNKTVTWSSNNTSVATVDSTGKVTAVKVGTATITATSNNGKTASCTVTVSVLTGWQKIGDHWYYYDSNGSLHTGWLADGGKWYYLDGKGVMCVGWKLIGGKWYYLKSNGEMATGWNKINNKWYYFASSGDMKTGWQTIGGKTYYFKKSGEMAAKEWCEGYWLNGDGTWTYKYKATWKQNNRGWWFGDTSGWYAKNTTITINGKSYTIDAYGYLK